MREAIGAVEGGGSGLQVLIGRLEEIDDLSHDVDYKLVQELLKVLSVCMQPAWQPPPRAANEGDERGREGPGAGRGLGRVTTPSACWCSSSSSPSRRCRSTSIARCGRLISGRGRVVGQDRHGPLPLHRRPHPGAHHRRAGELTADVACTPPPPPPASSPLPSPSDAAAASSSPAQEQFQALLVSLSSPAVRAHSPLTSCADLHPALHHLWQPQSPPPALLPLPALTCPPCPAPSCPVTLTRAGG